MLGLTVVVSGRSKSMQVTYYTYLLSHNKTHSLIPYIAIPIHRQERPYKVIYLIHIHVIIVIMKMLSYL